MFMKEKSIIQQIIYKENNTKLPDSNIKRVSKLKKRNIIYIMIAIIVLIAIKISSLYCRFVKHMSHLIDINIV